MDRLVAAMIALFAGLTLLPRYMSVQHENLTQFQTILQGATKSCVGTQCSTTNTTGLFTVGCFAN